MLSGVETVSSMSQHCCPKVAIGAPMTLGVDNIKYPSEKN